MQNVNYAGISVRQNEDRKSVYNLKQITVCWVSDQTKKKLAKSRNAFPIMSVYIIYSENLTKIIIIVIRNSAKSTITRLVGI